MTEQELIEFLKRNLGMRYEYEDYSCSYPQVVITLCGEDIASTPLYGLQTS